jgi:hypothetical protein
MNNHVVFCRLLKSCLLVNPTASIRKVNCGWWSKVKVLPSVLIDHRVNLDDGSVHSEAHECVGGNPNAKATVLS